MSVNIGQVKILCWGTAGLLASGLALYVAWFVRDLDAKRRLPDPNKIQQDLEKAEVVKAKPPETVSYDDVRRLFLPSCERCKDDPKCRHLNWTGKPPPAPATPTNPGEASKPPVVAVSELVTIQMIMADLSDRKLSRVWLKYRPKAGVQNNAAGGGFWLHEGDRLASPHESVRIDSIGHEDVTFVFDDANRTPETLTAEKFTKFDLGSAIVQVENDGVLKPLVKGPPKADVKPWNPARTTAFGNNRYMLGSEDVTYANENYAKILADEVRTGRHQDPRTGKYDGIEVQSVSPGSFAERHGAQEGDVIKSVNGHPVTSVQEAINYAKMNSGQFTTWEIVVERNGKLHTFYYQSPPNQ